MTISIIRNRDAANAFAEGRRAFHDDEPLGHNPYKIDALQANAVLAHHWDFGWVTACQNTARNYRGDFGEEA